MTMPAPRGNDKEVPLIPAKDLLLNRRDPLAAKRMVNSCARMAMRSSLLLWPEELKLARKSESGKKVATQVKKKYEVA